MDPITAIGLAASIVSFIDFSWNLLTGAKELYESGCRRTKENARISSIVDDLNEYALELTIGGEGASKHEKALRTLANDCQSLSGELVKILQKLEMTKNSRWQSLKKTWEAKRKAGDVALIESRLEKYRAQMNTRLLALLRCASLSAFEDLICLMHDERRMFYCLVLFSVRVCILIGSACIVNSNLQSNHSWTAYRTKQKSYLRHQLMN